MNKKSLIFLAILMGMTLVGCNPNFNDDSSVGPGSSSTPGSSEEFSPSSEAGGEDTSTSEEETSEEGDDDSSSSSSSETTHTHTFAETPTFFDDPDYMIYQKGYNARVCTYEGCDEQLFVEYVYYSREEMLGLMNTFISGKQVFDVFEIRQLLIDNNYPVVDPLTDNKFFGYDTSTNKLAISDGSLSDNFVSFREKEVSSLHELLTEISNIDADGSQYSVIKLTSDIVTDTVIPVNSAHPIEIDLNGHKVTNTTDDGSAFKISKGNNPKPVVAIINGTIETKSISGSDLSKSPECVNLIDADSLRLTNVTLNNRAERGYAFIDYANKNSDIKVKINESTIKSVIVAICIQANDNLIVNNNIEGVVVINGGTTVIDKNTVDASKVQQGLDQEANTLITCPELYEECYKSYVTNGNDYYMLTATDAILIYDRRSVSGTYGNPEVTVTNNTLKCKVGANNAPFGYGVRYMDLKFDASLEHSSKDLGIISIDPDNNEFVYRDSGSQTDAGGYILWEKQS